MFHSLLVPFIVFALFWTSKIMVAQDVQPLVYEFGYHGNNLWNPGIKAGAGLVWRKKTTTTKKVKKRYHQTTLNGNIGFYLDPGSHVGTFLEAGLTYRKFHPNDWFLSLGINPLGVYRSFLPETYEVDLNGNTVKKTLPGRTCFSPSGSIGFGKLRKDSPNGWFVKTNLMFLIPYNTYILPLLNIEAGYAIKLR
jgi:hypothetical protein